MQKGRAGPSTAARPWGAPPQLLSAPQRRPGSEDAASAGTKGSRGARRARSSAAPGRALESLFLFLLASERGKTKINNVCFLGHFLRKKKTKQTLFLLPREKGEFTLPPSLELRGWIRESLKASDDGSEINSWPGSTAAKNELCRERALDGR